MTNLLIAEQPLIVLPELAEHLGLNQALFLQQLHYWTEKSDNWRDGYRWVYNTYDDWQKQFKFWSARTVWAVIKKLEDQGIVVSGNFNKLPADRTKWYRIDYVKFEEAISQILRDRLAKVARPIPETTTETTTATNVAGVPPETRPMVNPPLEGEIVGAELEVPPGVDILTSEPKTEYGNPDVNNILSTFELTFELKLKRVRQQRIAASNLIKSYGLANVLGAIRAAGEVRDEQYAPQILSLEDLWSKWDKLVAHYRRNHAEKKSKVTIIEED